MAASMVRRPGRTVTVTSSPMTPGRGATAALDAEGVDYLLMGGVGSAAVGRPRWTHDIDFFVRPEDAHRVLKTLAKAGFTTEETYPDWLFKGFKNDVMVDVIFKSAG